MKFFTPVAEMSCSARKVHLKTKVLMAPLTYHEVVIVCFERAFSHLCILLVQIMIRVIFSTCVVGVGHS